MPTTCSNNHVILAAALDPRIKPFLSRFGLCESSIKKSLANEWVMEYEQSFNSTSVCNRTQPGTETQDSFLSLLGSNVIPESSSAEPFSSEVDRWMAHSPMNLQQSSKDVCQWMKVNTAMYPRISIMARDYLGVTSTSVSSECAFSRAGNTVDDQRARLSDDCVQAICELQSFLSFNKSH